MAEYLQSAQASSHKPHEAQSIRTLETEKPSRLGAIFEHIRGREEHTDDRSPQDLGRSDSQFKGANIDTVLIGTLNPTSLVEASHSSPQQ